MSETITMYDPATKPAVELTASAIAYVKKDIKKHQALGLRLGVKKAGCSGYKYVVDYVHTPEKNDRIISIEDELTVYIDSESLLKLYGLKIDYVKEGLNGKLVFINPNEKGTCGCGESFST
jgi:iron-sulfur cluster assembly accessory protein